MYARTLCIAIAATVVSLSAARAHADVGEDQSLYSCTKARSDVFVNLKPETELADLVDWAMTFTCKKFIYNSKIKGRSAPVTLVAPGKMSPREAWRVFLVALQSANLTVVPKRGILEIVEAPQAKEKPLPVYRPEDVRAIDQIVRVVLRPQHIGVDDLSEVLGAIKSKDGAVVALPKAGILLVTDYGSTLDRMLSVMKQVDEPIEREHIYIVKLNHANAATAATKLTELLGADGSATRTRTRTRTRTKGKREIIEVSASAPTKIIPDERTNTLLIVAEDRVYQRVRKLLKYIDLPMPGGDGGMYVYRLENADATALATTLTNSLSSASTGAGQQKRKASSPGAGALGGVAFEGDVRVTADTESNALVVIASVRDFASLREVIGELDRPRRQVFIEAVIVELTLDHSRTLGATLHVGDVRKIGGKSSAVFGGIQHNDFASLNLADSLAKNGTGGIAGVVGPTLPGVEELLGISIPSFTVLVQALATRGHLDVVSAPYLTALDNRESTITVGRNIPFQSNTTGLNLTSPSTNGTTPFTAGTSVERQKVGLTLKIKPFINESDLIRLEIDQELQDLAPPVNDLGPTWTERKITTSVVVQDQQTVVIGGLVQERLQTEESKVPLLGDIPLIGRLFRRERRIKQKTNLLVILTPYVIKSPMDMQRILDRKSREQNEFAATLETFDHSKYRPDIDYGRRRGVLEEINRSVMKIERDKALLREFQEELSYPDGPIE